MKVVYKLSVWALRARSYKTRAEDWAAGHRPPSSSRGLFWVFVLLPAMVRWVQGVQGVQEVQEVQKVQEVQRFKRFKRFNGFKGGKVSF